MLNFTTSEHIGFTSMGFSLWNGACFSGGRGRRLYLLVLLTLFLLYFIP